MPDQTNQPRQQSSSDFSNLYRNVAVAAIVLQLLSIIRIMRQNGSNLPEILYKTLYIHPAQASIGWDVICTTIVWSVWMLLDFSQSRAEEGISGTMVAGLLAATPVLGVTATTALYMSMRRSAGRTGVKAM